MATLDVLNAAEALDAINGVTADATELAAYTESTSLMLDLWIGPVVQRTVTAETVDADGSNLIRVGHYPFSAVTSISDYGTVLTEETDATSPPASGYILTPYSAASPGQTLYGPQILRRSGGADASWSAGRGRTVITYTAGRVANTAAVSQRHKAAARIILQNLWRSQQVSVGGFDEFEIPHQSFPRFGLPNAARHLLAAELQHDPQHGTAFV